MFLKKGFALIVLLVAFFPIFSFVAFSAENNDAAGVQNNTLPDRQLVGNDRDSHGCIGSAGYSWCEAKQKCLRLWEEKCNKFKELDENRFQILKNSAIDAINNLRKTDFEKIRGLKKEELDKLKDLKAEDFNNWSQLKGEKLKELAALKQEEIDKIKGLRAEQLWKVSNLRKDQLKKLAGDLNSEEINRIVSMVPGQSLKKLLELTKEDLKNISDLNDEELAQISQLDDNSLRDIAKQPMQQIRERLKNALSLNKERMQYLLSRERFEFAREKFQDAKQNFLEKKNDFNQLREKFKKAPKADKNALGEELRDNAQQVLLHQVSAILNHLEAVQNKNVDLSDVNALIAQFTPFRIQLEDNNVSKETLVEIASQIRHSWGQLKELEQRKILVALNTRLGSLIDKSNKAYDKANAKVAELNQAGKDTNKIEAALVVYKQKIDEAKALQVEVSGLLASQDLNANIAKIKRDIKQANNKLLNSFHILKRIIHSVNKVNAGETIEAIDTTEIVSENPEPEQ